MLSHTPVTSPVFWGVKRRKTAGSTPAAATSPLPFGAATVSLPVRSITVRPAGTRPSSCWVWDDCRGRGKAHRAVGDGGWAGGPEGPPRHGSVGLGGHVLLGHRVGARGARERQAARLGRARGRHCGEKCGGTDDARRPGTGHRRLQNWL